MNTRALFSPCCSLWHHSPPPPATGLSKNGWCQTMTEDGQALVMLKKWHDWYYRPDAGMPEWCTDALGQPYQY